MASPQKQRRFSGTAQQFFNKLKSKGDLVDEIYSSGIGSECKKFSQIFKVLFPGDEEYGANVWSWLSQISTGFYFQERNVSKEDQDMVHNLFQKVDGTRYPYGYRVDIAYGCVYDFFIYLTMVYQILARIRYNSEDNIFEFFKGINFCDVKVVFVGQDPSPGQNAISSGYAFHGAACPTTKFILEEACQEVNFFMKLNGEVDAKLLTDEDIDRFKQNHDMKHWIDSGVLLMNSYLTIHEHERFEIRRAWEYFTDYVVTSLSTYGRNIAFVLGGKEASRKEHLIDKKNHMVIPIHHPTYQAKHSKKDQNRDQKSYLDWHRMLPFINTNFYAYQCDKKNRPITWVPAASEFKYNSVNLFEKVINISQHLKEEAGSFVKYGPNLLIFKGGDGKLFLRYHDSSDNFLRETTGVAAENIEIINSGSQELELN